MTANIWAVGRNYQEHARELGNPLPSAPLFFLKAGSCIQTGEKLKLIPGLGEIHHEVELALKLDDHLRFSHFAIALDLTDRTAQNKAKAEGLPWMRAKSFRGACVLGEWHPFKESEAFFEQVIELEVNGVKKQSAALNQMIFKPDFLLKELTQTFPVCPDDILLTGTPSGVGPLKTGDRLLARIGSVASSAWTVVQ